MKTFEQKKDEFIKKRIAVKDEREDARSRQINVSWSINAAINLISHGEKSDGELATREDVEKVARSMLRLFDKLYEERSQESARKEEEYDEAKTAAELEAGDVG